MRTTGPKGPSGSTDPGRKDHWSVPRVGTLTITSAASTPRYAQVSPKVRVPARAAGSSSISSAPKSSGATGSACGRGAVALTDGLVGGCTTCLGRESRPEYDAVPGFPSSRPNDLCSPCDRGGTVREGRHGVRARAGHGYGADVRRGGIEHARKVLRDAVQGPARREAPARASGRAGLGRGGRALGPRPRSRHERVDRVRRGELIGLVEALAGGPRLRRRQDVKVPPAGHNPNHVASVSGDQFKLARRETGLLAEEPMLSRWATVPPSVVVVDLR